MGGGGHVEIRKPANSLYFVKSFCKLHYSASSPLDVSLSNKDCLIKNKQWLSASNIKLFTAHQTDIEYVCMSICLPAHLVNATNQDVTTPLSLPLHWLEKIKREPSFAVQDELTTKTCGCRARQNNNLAAFTQGKMTKLAFRLAFRLALGIWRYFHTSTVPPPGHWPALSTEKEKTSNLSRYWSTNLPCCSKP